jgi:hypothetical protein
VPPKHRQATPPPEEPQISKQNLRQHKLFRREKEAKLQPTRTWMGLLQRLFRKWEKYSRVPFKTM